MQQRFTKCRQLNQHFAMIFIPRPAPQCSALHQPVDQLNRTVMAKTQLLRNRSHRRPRAPRKSLDGKQKLVLLRLYTL